MIPVFNPSVGEEELRNVEDAIRTNWISSKGKYIPEFEEKFARYCDAKYGVTTTNGTTALHLALACIGIEPGDEVIIPNFTIISTALAVHYLGAKPIFVDVEEETGNIDVKKIEEKITPKTKAIMPVHIYGHPCDMDEINELAKKYKLYVIEDAAEAHGAEYRGKKVGAIGNIGCFSFYSNKLITTGEGGMIITNDEKIYKKAQSLKDLAFGKENRFEHEEIGFNYRMTNIKAAIGVGQMKKINIFLEKKIENAQLYNSLLKNIPGIKIPFTKDYVKNSYWMYTIRVDPSFGISKNEMRKKLLEEGIDTRDYFFPLNEQPIFRKLGISSNEEFPISKKLSNEGIYLPFGMDLKKEEIKYICYTIEKIMQKRL